LRPASLWTEWQN